MSLKLLITWRKNKFCFVLFFFVCFCTYGFRRSSSLRQLASFSKVKMQQMLANSLYVLTFMLIQAKGEQHICPLCITFLGSQKYYNQLENFTLYKHSWYDLLRIAEMFYSVHSLAVGNSLLLLQVEHIYKLLIYMMQTSKFLL